MNLISFFLVISIFLQIFEIGEAVVRNVTTASQFQKALDTSQPGDTISITSGDVLFQNHEFVANPSGTPDNPILITGKVGSTYGGSVIIQGTENPTNAALTIKGDHWKIEGVELLISKVNQGMLVEGNNNFITAPIIQPNTGGNGVKITGNENTLDRPVIDAVNGTGILLLGTHNTVIRAVLKTGKIEMGGSHHSLRNVVTNGEIVDSSCESSYVNVIAGKDSYDSMTTGQCSETSTIAGAPEETTQPDATSQSSSEQATEVSADAIGEGISTEPSDHQDVTEASNSEASSPIQEAVTSNSGESNGVETNPEPEATESVTDQEMTTEISDGSNQEEITMEVENNESAASEAPIVDF